MLGRNQQQQQQQQQVLRRSRRFCLSTTTTTTTTAVLVLLSSSYFSSSLTSAGAGVVGGGGILPAFSFSFAANNHPTGSSSNTKKNIKVFTYHQFRAAAPAAAAALSSSSFSSSSLLYGINCVGGDINRSCGGRGGGGGGGLGGGTSGVGGGGSFGRSTTHCIEKRIGSVVVRTMTGTRSEDTTEKRTKMTDVTMSSPEKASASMSSSSSSSSVHDSKISKNDTSIKSTISNSISISGEKLMKLRSKMLEVGVDAYLIPSDDPHLSEYVSDAYARRAFISGFMGSAGTALVTKDKAWLWTDSRYYNEATLQLDSDYWTLMKIGKPKTPTIPKFLAELAVEKRSRTEEEEEEEERTTRTFKIGLDPFVHAASFAQELEDILIEAQEDMKNGEEEEDDAKNKSVNGGEVGERSSSSLTKNEKGPIGVIDTLDEYGNLVDYIWSNERPPIPTSPFRVHPLKYAGLSISDKLKSVREAMVDEKVSLCIFSALDDVAYLLNIRAKGDVECNPVGIAYCTVSHEGATLYCDIENKVGNGPVKAHLEEGGVTLASYDDIISDIKKHLFETKLDNSNGNSNSNNNKNKNKNKNKPRVWIDKSRCNYAISRVIPKKNLLDKQNPITPLKALKNEAEMNGMRKAHIVDGVAMAHFMSWLENEIVIKERKVDEVEIDEVLTCYRAKQPGFLEVSFPTIAGVGSNGAIIHYRAQRENMELLKYLDTTQPILIDSGGQYEYGTTDVTRTWYFGDTEAESMSEFKEYYTRVLKGNIGVDTMIWPENTPGFVLDMMARKSLWDICKDYGHGTGHGVGAALNVHEGPQSISPRWLNKEPLKAGMIVSNEPGYYEDGRFGIRIENLLEIVNVNVNDEVNNYKDENPAAGGEKEEEEEEEEKDSKGEEEAEEHEEQKLMDKETMTTTTTTDQKQYLRFRKLTFIPIQKNLIDIKLMSSEELDWLDEYHSQVYNIISPHLKEGSLAMNWLRKSCEKIERS